MRTPVRGAPRWRSSLTEIGAAVGAVGAAVLLGRLATLNAASIGFILLLAVLAVAVTRRLGAALIAAILATLAFNYFFLPPFYTLTIYERANWVALACFLAVAVFASRLIGALRERTAIAATRQAEVETLYGISFDLVTEGPEPGALRGALALAIGRLDAEAGAILARSAEGRETLAATGDAAGLERELPPLPSGEPAIRERADGRRDATVPLLAGAERRGLLLLRGTTASPALLRSAGQLLGLAIERDRLLAAAARAEALRQSDALRAAILRAVSHDLRSPLTAMGLAIERLRRELPTVDVAMLDRERSRLARRIDNLLALARLEGGLARPHPEATPPGELLRAAREALTLALEGREVQVVIAADCPDLDVDPALAPEIVVNLLENAARLSPPGTPIEVHAAPDPGGAQVVIEVIDRGPGLPPALAERYAVPSPPAAAPAALGLGLEVARGLADANRGSLVVLRRPGGGTIARLVLPAVARPADTLPVSALRQGETA
ncbi:MAG: DUF4118 domain-containing protein [Acidobacteriota bacterium]